jgi:hypothetical protein
MARKVNKTKGFDFLKEFWENDPKIGFPGKQIRPKTCFIRGKSQLEN